MNSNRMSSSDTQLSQELLKTRVNGVAMYEKIISKQPKLFVKQLKNLQVDIKPQPNPAQFKSHGPNIDYGMLMINRNIKTDIDRRKEKADRILKYYEIREELDAKKGK